MTVPPFTIRSARHGDEDLILALLGELAEYEKLADKFQITRQIVARDFIGPNSPLHVDLLHQAAHPVGIVTWYFTYTSFAAARGIYLEDLFVRPAFRGRGYGKALLAHLAKQAGQAGACRVDWSVLTWNKPAIDFYESLGAERVSEWFIYRVSGEALGKLGT